MAADHTLTFTTVSPTLRIHEIQGSSHLSPYAGQRTSFVPGVVTAVRNNGFWMQDPSPDGSADTSEGIFVFTSSAPTVTVGTAVTVSGLITEFRPGGASTDNLTTTELESVTIYPGTSGSITPTVVGQGGRVPPNQVIDDDATGSVETSGLFQPTSDGIDFYESLEGMLLQVNNAVAVGPTSGFGEVFVVGDNGANAGPRTNRGGVVITPTDFNPERIQLDDVLADTPDMNVGDRIPGATVGVLSYDFANFELLPRTAPVAVSGGLARETTSVPRDNELSVATFNVENLDPADVATIPRLAALVADNLRAPDLIGIEEMQDNNGETNNGNTDASLSGRRSSTRSWLPAGRGTSTGRSTRQNNADGGAPGGNIRVGFLFRSDRGLRFVDRLAATRRRRPPSSAHAARPASRSARAASIPQTRPGRRAQALGRRVRVEGQRLSRLSTTSAPRAATTRCSVACSRRSARPRSQRHQQAAVGQRLRRPDPGGGPTGPTSIVLGDINDFEFSETMRILEGDVLTSLLDTLPKARAVLVRVRGQLAGARPDPGLTDALPSSARFDVVHVNAEFADQASDHDPSVARLELDD